jgi:hypothetical protein
MLLICCFCDQVRDESVGYTHWRNLHVYMVSRKAKREDTILSYTCCDSCLENDPRASAFRTRQRRSRPSVLPARAWPVRSVAA